MYFWRISRLNHQSPTELPEGDAADHLEPGQLDRAHRFRRPQEARYTQPSPPDGASNPETEILGRMIPPSNPQPQTKIRRVRPAEAAGRDHPRRCPRAHLRVPGAFKPCTLTPNPELSTPHPEPLTPNPLPLTPSTLHSTPYTHTLKPNTLCTLHKQAKGLDVNKVKVNVIGGHAGTTIVPLLSQVLKTLPGVLDTPEGVLESREDVLDTPEVLLVTPQDVLETLEVVLETPGGVLGHPI